MTVQKVTISEIRSRKHKSGGAAVKRVVAVTAYDYPMALIADRAGVDIVLVGDSGGMVALGHADTRAVTMEEMIYMSSAVAKGAKRALLVGDMPFLSYQTSAEDAIRNAGRFIKVGGMDAVKIEGGSALAPTVRALTRAGIPVMGHIGFTPQTSPTMEGYRVQGKTREAALKLVEDAKALEEAGACCIVLEMTTVEAAKMITDSLSIPTIGIGAGQHCDGQILVLHDIIGLFDRPAPKFAKKYMDLTSEIQKAIESYCIDVASGRFPGEEHAFHMDEVERVRLGEGSKGDNPDRAKLVSDTA